jgi:broad specificity phosphatase PhoE
MNIFITRHGETFWNLKKRIQTHSDGKKTWLTRQGKDDSEEKGRVLSQEDIQVIYHSGMHRTRQSSAIIAQFLHHPILIEDPRFRDVCLGFFDGMTYVEVQEKFPELFKELDENWFSYHIPTRTGFPPIENRQDALNRVQPRITSLLQKGENFLIVSHGTISMLILYSLLKDTVIVSPEDLRLYEMPTTAIYRVQIGQSIQVSHHLCQPHQEWVPGLIKKSSRDFYA